MVVYAVMVKICLVGCVLGVIKFSIQVATLCLPPITTIIVDGKTRRVVVCAIYDVIL